MERLKTVFFNENLNFRQHVKLLPLLDPKHFRGLLSQANLYLDTIGFSGFNTALQAIEQNLPVVTMDGNYMRGRLASGILKRIGLEQLIAKNQDEYVELVTKLVTDPEFNLKIREHIATNKTSLFLDKAPIIALQEFLISKCRPQDVSGN